MKLRQILLEHNNPPNPAKWLWFTVDALSTKPYFSTRPQPKRLHQQYLVDLDKTIIAIAQELLSPYGKIEVKSRTRLIEPDAEYSPKEQNGTSSVEFPWTEGASPYLALDFWVRGDQTLDMTTADMIVHEIMHGATELRSNFNEFLGGDVRGTNDDPEEIHNRSFSAANELLQSMDQEVILRGLARPESLRGHSKLFDSYLGSGQETRKAFLSGVYRFVRDLAADQT